MILKVGKMICMVDGHAKETHLVPSLALPPFPIRSTCPDRPLLLATPVHRHVLMEVAWCPVRRLRAAARRQE